MGGHDDMAAAQQRIGRQDLLAVTLALIAGYIDAYAFINYKAFSSFMSGNTTQTGLQAGEGNFAVAWHNLFPIPAFVVGVFAGTLLLHARLGQPTRWLFAAVAALLAAALLGVRLGPLPDWCAVVLLAVAMGTMNVTVTRVGAQAVALGYVTGSLNNLAQHLALAVRHAPVPQSQGAWDTHGRRAALLASVWVGFLIGAVLGGAATPRFAAWTLLLPTVSLVALAVFDRATSSDT